MQVKRGNAVTSDARARIRLARVGNSQRIPKKQKLPDVGLSVRRFEAPPVEA
jgi:hypothetical protein